MDTLNYIILALGGLSLFSSAYALYKVLTMPSNEEVLEELAITLEELDTWQNEIRIYMADTNERLAGILKPMYRRQVARETREQQQQDLNTGEPIKQGGIISISEARKRGLIK